MIEMCPAGHERTPENTYQYARGRACKVCTRQRSREWAKNNPKRARELARRYVQNITPAMQAKSRRQHLMKKYGITVEEFQALWASQKHQCGICSKVLREKAEGVGRLKSNKGNVACVDHCHVTGRIRGILCSNCNTAVGYLRDDPAIARAAARYLDSTQPTPGGVPPL